MRRKNRLTIIGSICLALVLSVLLLPACAAEEAPAPGKAIQLTWTTYATPGVQNEAIYVQSICDAIEEGTDFRVNFKIHWSASLGGAGESYDLVKDGLADMSYFPSTYIPGKFPLCEIGNLPMASQDPAGVASAMHALTDQGYFDEEWREIVLLGWLPTGTYDFLIRKHQPMTYEELAGLKIRSPGGYYSKFLTEIGMVPVKVLPAEQYTSWEKGLIDVFTHSPLTFCDYKLIEVPTKSHLDLNYALYSATCVIFNKDKWATLPADIQDVIRKVSREQTSVFTAGYLGGEPECFEAEKAAGVEIYSLPDSEMAKLKAAAGRVWEMWIADVEGKGLPAREVAEAYAAMLREAGADPPYPAK